jgi:hypothetical protein
LGFVDIAPRKVIIVSILISKNGGLLIILSILKVLILAFLFDGLFEFNCDVGGSFVGSDYSSIALQKKEKQKGIGLNFSRKRAEIRKKAESSMTETNKNILLYK